MHERENDASTDFGTELVLDPGAGTRIGSVPGQAAEVDISGYPGGGTGWGAWPDGMGTSEEMAGQARAEINDDDADTDAGEERIGARHN